MGNNVYKMNDLKIKLLSITPNAEKIIEEAGRTCYLSQDKIKESSDKAFIQRLIKLGHDSVLEHAYATFRIENCSRAMTHQLVRHRLMSFSQQSQRYVDEENFRSVVPKTIKKEDIDDFHKDMIIIRQMYNKWRQRGIKKEDARFVLPNACSSEIVVSANFREWRHVLKIRLLPKAQWEIRETCLLILEVLKEYAPSCFSDFKNI